MTASPNRPVVLMLIDGLGFDAIGPETTPNLHALAPSTAFRPLKPVLGYSDTQRAVLFTGRMPDHLGYWMLYRFAEPSQSPWRRYGSLSLLDSLPVELPRKLLKFGLSATVLKAQARLSGFSDLNIHNIPFRVLPWFAPTLRTSAYAPGAFGNVPTIFDLMRDANRPQGIVRSDTVDKLTLLKSIETQLPRLQRQIAALPEGTSFAYFYIHTPDMFAHRNGLRAPAYRDEMRKVDAALPGLFERLKQRMGADTQIVLVSDHGMNHTERFVDYQRLVHNPRAGKDFVPALDSTMVRFRYLTPQGRGIARELMGAGGNGRFLSDDEKRELGVAFPGEAYGDDLYLLEPGFSIYPNYHSLLRPLAMHAYHPDVPDQQAIAFFIGDDVSERGAQNANLAMNDIFGIVCASLGVGASAIA